MEAQRRVADRIREWHRRHTEGALTQYQPKFWIIFWSTAALGVVLHFLTAEYIAPYLNQNGRFLLILGCLSLPLLALRNLHLEAFLLLGLGILNVLR